MNKRIYLSLLFIASLSFVSFLPTFQNGWTTWDDDAYVVDNPVILDFSIEGIEESFSSFYNGSYLPLTIISYMVDYRIDEFNPKVFHGTNLLFHIFNSLLVFWLIVLLDGNISVALVVATLFGIHPMHVESVAWISGRKDVLSMFFFLLSLLSYLYYIRTTKTILLINSFLFFIFALLSKVIVITFPILMLLVDYYFNRKDLRNIILEKAPFFLAAAGFAIIGYFAQISQHALKKTDSVFTGMVVSLHGITFYLEKLFLPINLSSFYPYTKDLSFEFYFYAFMTLVIFFLVWKYNNNKILLFGFLFYLISLLPVLQFIRFSQIFAADRFTYLSYIGLFFIVAKWGVSLVERISTKPRIVVIAIAFVIVGWFAILTWERASVWKDTQTLWKDVFKKYPNAFKEI